MVNRRRNDDPLNAANKVFFYPVEDIETVIAEHSIRDIYYIESNDTGGLSKEEAFRLAEEHSL